jgi:hypothetical protein
MTADQLVDVLQKINRRWPHAPISDDAHPEWAEDLAGLSYDVVLGAVVAISREGREFAPTPGQVFARTVRLSDPIPDFDEAWNELRKNMRDHGSRRLPRTMQWSRPEVQELAEAIGWQDWGQSDAGDPTWRAQARGMWESICRRAEERRLHVGAPFTALNGSRALTVVDGSDRDG